MEDMRFIQAAGMLSILAWRHTRALIECHSFDNLSIIRQTMIAGNRLKAMKLSRNINLLANSARVSARTIASETMAQKMLYRLITNYLGESK